MLIIKLELHISFYDVNVYYCWISFVIFLIIYLEVISLKNVAWAQPIESIFNFYIF